MSSQRERVTIVTITDGKEVERKKSKIVVHRCDECGEIIHNYDDKKNVCRLCNNEVCESHWVEVPYLGDGWNKFSGGCICTSCNKEYSEDLKFLKLAADAYMSASTTHDSCGKVGSELIGTLRRNYEQNKAKSQTGDLLG